MIDHPVLLLGGKKDFDRGEDIASFDPVKVYNACGKFSLAESADLLRRSKLVISHDTGLMQIAAALKKPIITLWGSTTPSLKKGPYYGSDHLKNNPKPYEDLQVRHLWCRPCTTEGRQNCPQGHFKCMKKMPLDLIASQVRLWLQGKV